MNISFFERTYLLPRIHGSHFWIYRLLLTRLLKGFIAGIHAYLVLTVLTLMLNIPYPLHLPLMHHRRRHTNKNIQDPFLTLPHPHHDIVTYSNPLVCPHHHNLHTLSPMNHLPAPLCIQVVFLDHLLRDLIQQSLAVFGL
ncbi:hypothetical protein K439DRAFT_1514628 [Ramaria rubella]|nr:hypothetical protein K439DRAFT_1514628 [Ramaria rubella]